MTPYEFGCRVKIAVETGGLGEYMGQGFDNGVKSFNKAIGMPELSPQAWGGGGAMPAAPVDQGVGLTDEVPMAAPMRPTPKPPRAFKTVEDQGVGLTDEVPTPARRVARPSPRPAAVKPAPAQPKPTAPGVRKPVSRIA